MNNEKIIGNEFEMEMLIEVGCNIIAQNSIEGIKYNKKDLENYIKKFKWVEK